MRSRLLSPTTTVLTLVTWLAMLPGCATAA